MCEDGIQDFLMMKTDNIEILFILISSKSLSSFGAVLWFTKHNVLVHYADLMT